MANSATVVYLIWAVCVISGSFGSQLKKQKEKAPIVNTKYGRISGTVLRSIQEPHFQYYAFRGIPYAKPPLGKLRFAAPQEPKCWRPKVKKCQEYGSQCLQLSNGISGSVVGSEDCLTINVFVKELRPEEPKPVMVFIHGGAFVYGSGDLYQGDYLAEEDVVLVVFNYRLGIFGFLSTLDQNAYGNWGYKDQVLALEWVRDNIASFGGDPSRVTLFGESAGAVSVNILQAPPRTEGLFHQVIVHSGSGFISLVLQRDPLKYVHNIGNFLNISLESSRTLVDGLRQIDATTLLETANNPNATGQEQNLHAFPFFPVVEPINSEAILASSPYAYFSTGNFHKVPYIYGYNTDEGTWGYDFVRPFIEKFDVDPTLFYPESFNNPKRAAEIGGKIRQFFLGNESATNNTDGLLRFLGQEILFRSERKVVDFLDHSEGYFYHFSYKGTHTTNFPGVGHVEELQYIFPLAGTTTDLTEDDVLIRKRMVKMWTNFAKTGSPIPSNEDGVLKDISWQKINARGDDSLNYLEISLVPEQQKDPDQDIYDFYAELFRVYGRSPIQTY